MAKLSALVGAAVLSVSLLSCQAGGDPLPADIGQVSYPLDRYRFSVEEQEVIDQATYELTDRCVRRFGLVLPAKGRARDLRPRDRYGLVDEEHAKVWAYSLDLPSRRAMPWFVAIDDRSRLFAVVSGSGSDAGSAVKDLPEGGCSGEARRGLGGEGVAEDPVVALDREAWSTSMKDDQVVEATRRWHRCMQDAGYRYPDPIGAPYGYWGEKRMARFAALSTDQKKSGIKPSHSEVEAALADVRCKHTSGLLTTWVAADIAQQRRLVDRDRERLPAHRRSLDLQLERAEQALTRH